MQQFSFLSNSLFSCQTYEGGFGGEPNCEAHGGYTLCGVAALSLLGQRNQVDDEALLRWLVMRQMPFEGGFQVLDDVSKTFNLL